MVAAVDNFVGRSNLDDPYASAAAVTPHDTNELTYVTRAIYIGTAGTLKLTMQDGVAVSFAAIAAGMYRIRAKIVWSTGTSAANIVALW